MITENEGRSYEFLPFFYAILKINFLLYLFAGIFGTGPASLSRSRRSNGPTSVRRRLDVSRRHASVRPARHPKKYWNIVGRFARNFLAKLMFHSSRWKNIYSLYSRFVFYFLTCSLDGKNRNDAWHALSRRSLSRTYDVVVLLLLLFL